MVSTADITAARLRRPGPDGTRILLIAGRTWLSRTRSPDEQRVPVRLLDRLWLSTRRGVELDVVCGVGRVLRLLDAFAGAWDLAQYDAVILLPDGGRTHMPARPARTVDRIAQVTPVLTVCPDAVRRRRVELAESTRAPDVEVAIDVPASGCPAAAVAEAIATALVGIVDPVEPLPASRGGGGHLKRIAALASDAFAAGAASIELLASGRPRTVAAVGPALGRSACSRDAGPRLVLDAWADPRFARNPLVHSGEGIRFFASHPIENGQGGTIGALSVFDPLPRTAEDFDAAVLADLAVLAGAEIQYAAAAR